MWSPRWWTNVQGRGDHHWLLIFTLAQPHSRVSCLAPSLMVLTASSLLSVLGDKK